MSSYIYSFGVQDRCIRNDGVLLKNLNRVRYVRVDSLGRDLVLDAVRVLFDISIGDVNDELFVESARIFGNAIDCDHLMSTWQNETCRRRYCVRAELKSALVLYHFPFNNRFISLTYSLII
jgi:hypothetical protein